MMDFLIAEAELSDAEAIARIYNHYVEHTVITFEEDPVSSTEMATRIAGVKSVSLPWFVARENVQVLGYTYATRWRTRSAYRHSVEVTVYVAPGAEGRGIGTGLYQKLFPALEAQDVHAAMGGIALPNQASIALHEKFGMRKVAHFSEVGRKFNRWVDVGYWQRTLGAASS